MEEKKSDTLWADGQVASEKRRHTQQLTRLLQLNILEMSRFVTDGNHSHVDS